MSLGGFFDEGDLVAVLTTQPIDRPLDYKAPEGGCWEGAFVEVPLGPRSVLGVIWGPGTGDYDRSKIRAVRRVLDAAPMSLEMREFLLRAADYTLTPLPAMLRLATRAPGLGDAPAMRHVYRLGSAEPDRMTAARARVLAVLRDYDGLSFTLGELAESAAVSPSVVKGLVKLGAVLEQDSPRDLPYPALDPDMAGKSLSSDQAAAVDMEGAPEDLWLKLLETEEALIPDGLHVVGQAPSETEITEHLRVMADQSPEAQERAASHLAGDAELQGLMRALSGRFIAPVPGGDLIRSPEVLPAGRNIHAFDPFRMPTAYALKDGCHQAEVLLAAQESLPRSVALVLWGSDNIKSDGGPISQALALLGAKPRFDNFGRLAGADLIPLSELGRPRIDVVMTLSGIFRDLLPLQTRMLAEAAWKAASAEEPLDQNFVRAHALAYAEKTGCDLEEAALRVFSNAEGAYGSNVNVLVDQSGFDDEDDLADAYQARKSFAYGMNGKAQQQRALLDEALADVDVAYQNLESVELGVTTVDHYFDTLGGIARAVKRAKGGAEPAVFIGDQTTGAAKVRTLKDQVALETRARSLNPKWFEGMLKHGHEGVRQIEAQVTNTMGWSATTGQVDPWVYERISETFVLDEEMRDRLSKLNPQASVRMAQRLLEASDREYWLPDADTLAALQDAADALEDRLEGVAAE